MRSRIRPSRGSCCHLNGGCSERAATARNGVGRYHWVWRWHLQRWWQRLLCVLPVVLSCLLCVALGAKPHTVARSPVRTELQHATKDELNDALVASLNKQSYVWQHIQKATIADDATKI